MAFLYTLFVFQNWIEPVTTFGIAFGFELQSALPRKRKKERKREREREREKEIEIEREKEI